MRSLIAGTRTYIDQVDPERDLSDEIETFSGSFEARRNALQTLSDLAKSNPAIPAICPSPAPRPVAQTSERPEHADGTTNFVEALVDIDRGRLVLVLARAEIKTRSKAALSGAREVQWLIGLAALGAIGVLILTLDINCAAAQSRTPPISGEKTCRGWSTVPQLQGG